MSRFYKVKTGDDEVRYIDLSRVVEICVYPSDETKCRVLLDGAEWHMTVFLPADALLAVIDNKEMIDKAVQS